MSITFVYSTNTMHILLKNPLKVKSTSKKKACVTMEK